MRFLILIMCLTMGCAAQRALPSGPGAFDSALAVVTDGDQGAYAYAFGKLDPVDGLRDSVTVVRMEDGKPVLASVPASNSVVSWPQVIDTSPDHKTLYVVETRGVPPAGTKKVKSVFTHLPEGSELTVIDVSDAAQPRRLETHAIGTNLEHVSVHPSGEWLAVNTPKSKEQVVFVRLTDDGVRLYSWNGTGDDDNRARVSNVYWHPAGEMFAATIGFHSVGFYRFAYDAERDAIEVEPIGEPLRVGVLLSVGRFTPDGRFFLVSDVRWWSLFFGAAMNSRGRLISIAHDDAGKHEVVTALPVGLSPEGFAISPGGDLAVTVNMRRTYLPAFPTGVWPGRAHASLTLIQIDPETGVLTRVGKDYRFKGVLPEDAEFDSSGNNLAVASYEDPESKADGVGYVELWRVVHEPSLHLERSVTRITVPRGPHDLLRIQIVD